MLVKVRETGKVVELSIVDAKTGVNWVADLIGNAGATIDGQFAPVEYHDPSSDEYDVNAPEHHYIADAATVAWWQEYIADTEATESESKALAAELGIDPDLVNDRISAEYNAAGDDYTMHRAAAITAMDAIREDYAVSVAAATIGRKGGRSTSTAKAAAARANGRKGGRPRKTA